MSFSTAKFSESVSFIREQGLRIVLNRSWDLRLVPLFDPSLGDDFKLLRDFKFLSFCCF